MADEQKQIAELMVRIYQKDEEPYMESSIDGNTIDIMIALSELIAHLSSIGIPEELLLNAFEAGMVYSKKHHKDELMA